MTQTQIGHSEDRPLRVAVVGAGPSGFYAVAALLDAPDLHVRVDVFDRLPAPFGLVRYGVAPDHQKIKLVSRVFEKAAKDPRVRFFGNVELGRDLSQEDLGRLYDTVIYAVGAQSDRRLGVPGEDLEGSWSSTEFVAWYNGHPDFAHADYPLDHERVAVVGIGNVAMDCARLLARPAEDLAATDVSDQALEVFRRSRVTDVWVLARRGPAQAACTPPELKELGELEDVDVLVDAAQLDDPEMAGEPDRQTAKNLEIFRQLAERGDRGMARRIRFRFLVSPVEVLGEDGRITGLVVERNELRPGADGTMRPAGTGETEVLPVTAVIRAIGYRSLPLPGVPFDERRGVIPNRDGRVLDPASGEAVPRTYVVGWAKRGPSGLIGTNKPDSQATVATLLADLAADPAAMAAPAAGPGPAPVAELLAERGVDFVDYEAWQCIDREETRRGEESGRPRVKLCMIDEMLAAVAAARQPVAD
jgi:ferredoxin/flavodoxin---NADP+ reductase